MVFQHGTMPDWAGTVGADFRRGQRLVTIRNADHEAFALVTTDIRKFEENEMEVPRPVPEVSSG